MNKIFLALFVAVTLLCPIGAGAQQVTDKLNVTVASLPVLSFNVVEDTVVFQFTTDQTGWINKPFNMALAGGMGGTVRIYASSYSYDAGGNNFEGKWGQLIQSGGLAVTTNTAGMKAGQTPIMAWEQTVTTSSTELTGAGFVTPVPSQTIPMTLDIDRTKFYGVFGAGYAYTGTAEVNFLAIIL